MIELPLTPSFFKKLGIYQDLTDKELTINKSLWPMEMALLIWTVKSHQHLATSITLQFVVDRLKEFGFKPRMIEESAPKVMGNLCQRGYTLAVNVDWIEDKEYQGAGRVIKEVKTPSQNAIDSPSEMIFTQEGLLAGRVLFEMKKGFWGKYKYKIFIILIYTTLAVLFIDIIGIKIYNWTSFLIAYLNFF